MQYSFREPIPALYDAARYLDAAVSAHLQGHSILAAGLLKQADMQEARDYTESIWGAKSPYVRVRPSPSAPTPVGSRARVKQRMPGKAEKAAIEARDGYHCRFCQVPVIPAEVRSKLKTLYPNAVLWGKKNIEQHAGLQALWLQYDHVVPHARGGTNDLENVVVTCAPCNYGKDSYCVEDLGLFDPRDRPPIQSHWDGLTRLLNR